MILRLTRVSPLLIAAFGLMATDLYAQTGGGVVCDTTAQEITAGWRLERTAVPASPAAWTSAAWRFGPYDRRALGFSSITFHVVDIGPFEEAMGNTIGPIDVVIRIDGDAPAWFRVVTAEAAKGPGALSAPQNLARDDFKYGSRTIRQIGAPGIPIFALELFQASTSGQFVDNFVVDLRPNRQRVPWHSHARRIESRARVARMTTPTSLLKALSNAAGPIRPRI
jgi:hypothetical protein